MQLLNARESSWCSNSLHETHGIKGIHTDAKIVTYTYLSQALTFVPLGLSITNTSLQIWMPVVSRSHPPLHVNPVNGSVFPPIQHEEVYKTRRETYLKPKMRGFFFFTIICFSRLPDCSVCLQSRLTTLHRILKHNATLLCFKVHPQINVIQVYCMPVVAQFFSHWRVYVHSLQIPSAHS